MQEINKTFSFHILNYSIALFTFIICDKTRKQQTFFFFFFIKCPSLTRICDCDLEIFCLPFIGCLDVLVCVTYFIKQYSNVLKKYKSKKLFTNVAALYLLCNCRYINRTVRWFQIDKKKRFVSRYETK